jgi:hypothetical protein
MGRDGLGHGERPEDGVFGERGVAGGVLRAIHPIVKDLAVAGEDGDGAGKLLAVDGLLHEGVQALEAFGRKADRFGPYDGHVDAGGAGGG